MTSNKQGLVGTLNAKVVEFETGNYNNLENKPSINGVELVGDKSLKDLGIEFDVDVDIPTKISELENDSGYITSIPEEYVTDEELNNKGYITSIPEDYAKKEYVDEKIGDIETILSTLATVSEE